MPKKIPREFFNGWKSRGFAGKGGQATIFRVQKGKGKFHALKEVILSNHEKKERFINEIKAIKEIDHPNIIKIIDHNMDTIEKAENGYYVMPYAKYGNLMNHIVLFENNIEFTLKYFLKICDAVLKVHERIDPIIHRDIKPQNILCIDSIYEPVLSDFGICYSDAFEERLTKEREIVGPRLMAPEQERGGDPTIKTDIYLLGKLLYMMLRGGKFLAREEFEEEESNLALIYKDERYETLNEELFSRMIKYEQQDRSDSVAEIITSIKSILNNKFILSFTPSKIMISKLVYFDDNHLMGQFEQYLLRFTNQLSKEILENDYFDYFKAKERILESQFYVNQYLNIACSAILIKSDDIIKRIIENLESMMNDYRKLLSVNSAKFNLWYLIISIIYHGLIIFSIEKNKTKYLELLLHKVYKYDYNTLLYDFDSLFRIERIWHNDIFHMSYKDTHYFIRDFLLNYCRSDQPFFKNEADVEYHLIQMNYLICLIDIFSKRQRPIRTNWTHYSIYGHYEPRYIMPLYLMFKKDFEGIAKEYSEKIFKIPHGNFFPQMIECHKSTESNFNGEWKSITSEQLAFELRQM